MIELDNNLSVFHHKVIYFSECPTIKNGLFSSYIQSACVKRKFGFIRISKFTKIIRLEDDSYRSEFNKTLLYKIRRAQKDEINCVTSNDVTEFVAFYNNFLKAKNIDGKIIADKLIGYGEHFIIRKALGKDGTPLVFHSYLIDRTIMRVRLLHSASTIWFNSELGIDKAAVGRANCLLHSDDLIYFKSLGLKIFDFGGYAFNTTDPGLQGINAFKDQFGGRLLEESNYELFPIGFIANILKFIRSYMI